MQQKFKQKSDSSRFKNNQELNLAELFNYSDQAIQSSFYEGIKQAHMHEEHILSIIYIIQID